LAVLILRGLHVYYAVENRRKKVEDILPDFLLLVAGNIRAGMTSFSAFKSSARPEFGALSEEIKGVTTRSLGTGSFTQALLEISTSIQSQSLSESVRFFIQASKSGGKIAQLLENTSNDLRRTQDLKRELESSTRTYVIFVAFVMVIATPLLMAVSVSFVELITSIQSQSLVSGDAGSSLGFLGGTLSITPIFLEGMAYVLLAGNAVLAGLFMGMIGQGKPLLGLRFTIPMLAVSIIVFWIARSFLGSLLGVA
jgi:flagellar protein FlaJ